MRAPGEGKHDESIFRLVDLSRRPVMPKLSNIAVCVFDAYGTLFDLGNFVDRFRGDLGEQAETLIGLWRRKQLEYSWLRSLMGRHTDFWHVTGESLDYAMASLNLANPALRSRLMEAWLTPRAYPEAESMLKHLQHSGMKTAILSNGSPTMLVSGLTSSGLGARIDVTLSVEKVGIFKPHPSAYKLAADTFEVDPKAVCFVSSNGWDVAGASAFGFRVVWVNRSNAPREELPAGPDVVLADLAGLPGVLGV
jgi:2-haloacid dehalogenase